MKVSSSTSGPERLQVRLVPDFEEPAADFVDALALGYAVAARELAVAGGSLPRALTRAATASDMEG